MVGVCGTGGEEYSGGNESLVTFASVSGYASKRRRSTLALDDGRLGQRNAECVGCTAWGRRLGSARGWVEGRCEVEKAR